MKKILITGKNSYIGTSLEKWLMKEPEKYEIEKIDMRDDAWKEMNFFKYDVVFHTIGIAHTKETKENQGLYYEINRDLAYETAKKSKQDGVKQFVFLSSMSVYGINNGVIDERTILKPKSAYGKSKVEAEKLIYDLQDDSFTVSILRPPMVYGKGCKGNYTRLAKVALKTPFFPHLENKRSMIYIDNLTNFLKKVIDSKLGGFFFPQNIDYVNTSELVKVIAEVNGKRVIMTKLFNPLLRLLNIDVINKVFGDLVYETSISDIKNDYNICTFRESIRRTEL